MCQGGGWMRGSHANSPCKSLCEPLAPSRQYAAAGLCGRGHFSRTPSQWMMAMTPITAPGLQTSQKNLVASGAEGGPVDLWLGSHWSLPPPRNPRYRRSVDCLARPFPSGVHSILRPKKILLPDTTNTTPFLRLSLPGPELPQTQGEPARFNLYSFAVLTVVSA